LGVWGLTDGFPTVLQARTLPRRTVRIENPGIESTVGGAHPTE